MGEKLREIFIGFSSAFDMGAGSYESPDYLSSSRLPIEILSDDWKKLCTDGQNAVMVFKKEV